MEYTVEKYRQFPILTHSNNPTCNPQLALPIPSQHDDVYWQALRSLANDPRLPSPLFGGQNRQKKWICSKCSPSNSGHQYEKCMGMGNPRLRSHWSFVGVNSANVKCPTNNDPSHRKITRWDGARIKSTATCTLALTDLPLKAREAHIITGLSHHSLILVVTLCNAGCNIKFTKIGCHVKYPGGNCHERSKVHQNRM